MEENLGSIPVTASFSLFFLFVSWQQNRCLLVLGTGWDFSIDYLYIKID